MGKRPAAACAAAAKAAKAAKSAEADPTVLKCREVAAALGEIEGLPQAVGGLLGDILPLSLALPREQRHVYQQGVVEAVGRELVGREEALERSITEAEGNAEQLARDREAQQAALAELEVSLTRRASEALDKRHVLADAALAFRRAKEGLGEAGAKQRAGNEELEEVARKHESLSRTVAEVLEPLKEGTLAREAVEEAAAGLVPALQRCFDVEESLIPAIPSVLSKEPSARGAFDTMAAVQLEEQAKKALQDFGEALKDAEASRAKLAALTEAAKEALAAAREQQLADAAAYTAARTEEENAQASVEAAKQALKHFFPERMRLARAVTKAQEGLRAFRGGPLAAFKELSELSCEPDPAAAVHADAEVASIEGADTETTVADGTVA